MSFQTLLIRGRRVAEIAEEYEAERSGLVPDIRDNLIEAQQAHIEALSSALIELGRQRRKTQPEGVALDRGLHTPSADAATPLDRGELKRPSVSEAWNALLSSLRPRWL